MVHVSEVSAFAGFVYFRLRGACSRLPRHCVVVAAPVVLLDWAACLVLLETFESPSVEPFPREKRLVFAELVFESVLGPSGYRVGDDHRLAWSVLDAEVELGKFLHPPGQSWRELGSGVHAGR